MHPSKKGAHNDAFFKIPSLHDYRKLYGEHNLREAVRYMTVAPELEGALEMIRDLKKSYPHIVISIGHSTASYKAAVKAVEAGATSITHVFNAMTPLGHREPGIPGLISIPAPRSSDIEEQDPGKRSLEASHVPFFTVIPDNVHLHPTILRLCHQANPERCILITDSIELAGLPDAIYPPNEQITYPQRKAGNRATNVADKSKGEKETLIGSCITLLEGLGNMMESGGVTIAQAARCASTNIAELMQDQSRGRLLPGRRADCIVLDKAGRLKQTWISGKLIWQA